MEKYSKVKNKPVFADSVGAAENADLMKEMYPHYVPTYRSSVITKNPVEQQNFAAINNGIKKATGSNRDLLPIMDSLANQTLQTYSAGRRNLFGNRLLEDTLTNAGQLGDYIHTISDSDMEFDPDEIMPDLN